MKIIRYLYILKFFILYIIKDKIKSMGENFIKLKHIFYFPSLVLSIPPFFIFFV